MVKQWWGILCTVGLLLGLTGCASQQVDLVGTWVYENPAGDGAARIDIERDGMFEITGWPSNLKVDKDGLGKAADAQDLNWDEPLSFSGVLDGTEAAAYSGVYFSSFEKDPWLNFNGYPDSTCDYDLFLCVPTGDEIRIYPNGLNDEINYITFVRGAGA